MEQNKAEWLPHLSSDIVADARGPELDAYVLALEGWRRGLTLRWHTKDSEKLKDMKTWFVDKPGKLFSLSSKEQTHYFFRTRGDKVTNEAVEIGSDKEKTKQLLLERGIRTPKGKQFDEDISNEAIIKYAEETGFPVAIKPTNGSFGRGVITNITSAEELSSSLVHLRDELNYKNMIVEQYIPGNEYRIYVIEDQAIAAMNRIPANVVGDGEHSVRTLIGLKNKAKELNPRLVSCQIKVNDEMINYIQNQGFTLDTILDQGEQLYLTNISNVSTGGDPLNVTGDLPEAVLETAIEALQAVPGLTHGAVDLIVDARKPIEQAATILELNPTAQIGGLLFPVKGRASDVPAAIIDYYFPETKNVDVDKTKLYFDFTDVLYPLVTRSGNTSTVTPFPLEPLFAKKYTVVGDVQQVGYHRGLRKQAFERYLNGLVLNLNNGDIDVVVAGTDPEMVDDFKNALWEDPERSEIQEVHESNWDGPIKIGFEVKADLKTQIEELQEIKHEMEALEFDLKKAKLQHKRYYKSVSWKTTSPLRVAGSLFKKIKRTNK